MKRQGGQKVAGRVAVYCGLCALCAGMAVCERSGLEPSAPAPPGAVSTTASVPVPGSVESGEPFESGEKTFATVMETLRNKYYRTELSDDGLLQQLEPRMSAWNKLLSPAEMRELRADMQGEIVGIGVEIRFEEDSGISDVVAVIPGSPADHAGIVAGDKILTVEGKFYKGKTLRDVVADLRGQPGETVKLTTLRGAEVLPFAVRREHVAYDIVKTMMIPGDVGYLLINQFTDNTPGAVQAGLLALGQKGARALVLDLRGNQGGLFDKAVATAELFLKKGTPIVKLRHRGGQEETLSSSQDPTIPLTKQPLAVLIDGDTASGAELLAAALREGISAQLIGQKSFGKGSIQSVDELPNHYGMKYTTSAFFTPTGNPVEGQGVIPDVDVALPVPAQSNLDRERSHVQHLTATAERLQADPPLRAAVNILKLRLQPPT